MVAAVLVVSGRCPPSKPGSGTQMSGGRRGTFSQPTVGLSTPADGGRVTGGSFGARSPLLGNWCTTKHGDGDLVMF